MNRELTLTIEQIAENLKKEHYWTSVRTDTTNIVSDLSNNYPIDIPLSVSQIYDVLGYAKTIRVLIGVGDEYMDCFQQFALDSIMQISHLVDNKFSYVFDLIKSGNIKDMSDNDFVLMRKFVADNVDNPILADPVFAVTVVYSWWNHPDMLEAVCHFINNAIAWHGTTKNINGEKISRMQLWNSKQKEDIGYYSALANAERMLMQNLISQLSPHQPN